VTFRLSVVTPSRSVVETDADFAVAPGSEGQFGVLPGHAPLLAALRAGVLTYSEAGRESRLAIGGGFAEVTQERMTVLAPSAESPEQIDPTEAEARRANAAAALDEAGINAPLDEVAKLREALERADARVDVLRG
jgi:F-type H+-transporting ATPase subunit epsilon